MRMLAALIRTIRKSYPPLLYDVYVAVLYNLGDVCVACVYKKSMSQADLITLQSWFVVMNKEVTAKTEPMKFMSNSGSVPALLCCVERLWLQWERSNNLIEHQVIYFLALCINKFSPIPST